MYGFALGDEVVVDLGVISNINYLLLSRLLMSGLILHINLH